ncbi:transposase [Streptomyces sp. NPDC003996]
MGTYKYPAEFRADAVALARSSGRPVSRIAAELGVNHETLRQWIKAAEKAERPEAVAETPSAVMADRGGIGFDDLDEVALRSALALIVIADPGLIGQRPSGRHPPLAPWFHPAESLSTRDYDLASSLKSSRGRPPVRQGRAAAKIANRPRRLRGSARLWPMPVPGWPCCEFPPETPCRKYCRPLEPGSSGRRSGAR